MASIRQVLQHRQIPVVVGIGGVVDWSNHLQGIDDDQHGVGVCGEECFYLLLQSLTDERALCAEVDAVRCVLGDLKEPVLDTENGVLQTEVEGGTLFGGHIPDRFSFGYCHRQPQSQPGLTHLWGAGKNVQALRKQGVHHKIGRTYRLAHQGCPIDRVEFHVALCLLIRCIVSWFYSSPMLEYRKVRHCEIYK